MSGALRSMISLTVLASLLAFASFSTADANPSTTDGQRGIKNFLTEHTLVYPDKKGEENLIHFGRFGTFDWYFPCQFESGTWNLNTDRVLSLTYDNPDFQSRQYKVARQDDGITLTDPGNDSPTVGKLIAGNRLPFG
ncbi:MAG: hypothetical protein HKN28_05775 [Alphaproteobacteria bacterium]|nr:hypothetical protein [Alphaproteobacteria bacterium]